MMTSLDGYMEGENHDLSWHNVDTEFNEFAAKQLEEIDSIFFGKNTYELMEGYWPTAKPEDQFDAVVAKHMNTLPKYVFSRTLQTVIGKDAWQNVHLVPSVTPEFIQKVKQESEKDIAVLGSNNLCVTLLENNLLDELRIMVNPLVIGKGIPLFAGIEKKEQFHLESSRSFKNGNVLLRYSIVKGGE